MNWALAHLSSHIAPLGRNQINLTGDYVWHA